MFQNLNILLALLLRLPGIRNILAASILLASAPRGNNNSKSLSCIFPTYGTLFLLLGPAQLPRISSVPGRNLLSGWGGTTLSKYFPRKISRT